VEIPGVTNARYPHAGPLLAGSLRFGEATASLIVGKWSAASGVTEPADNRWR
jgi:hypothetical protein